MVLAEESAGSLPAELEGMSAASTKSKSRN
jgi:hypothetical protein